MDGSGPSAHEPRGDTEIFPRVDAALARLPSTIQALVLEKITLVGSQLEVFPHYRMTGRNDYRLRVGDYRVIYQFNRAENIIDLIALGHRSKIYRD